MILRKKVKEEKGITLVALIITIIILIILAAVTINAVIHDGFIDIAIRGTENYTSEQYKELDEINKLTEKINNILDKTNGEDDGDEGGDDEKKTLTINIKDMIFGEILGEYQEVTIEIYRNEELTDLVKMIDINGSYREENYVLPNGTYWVKMVHTPAGYNTPDPMNFTISGKKEEIWDVIVYKGDGYIPEPGAPWAIWPSQGRLRTIVYFDDEGFESLRPAEIVFELICEEQIMDSFIIKSGDSGGSDWPEWRGLDNYGEYYGEYTYTLTGYSFAGETTIFPRDMLNNYDISLMFGDGYAWICFIYDPIETPPDAPPPAP